MKIETLWKMLYFVCERRKKEDASMIKHDISGILSFKEEESENFFYLHFPRNSIWKQDTGEMLPWWQTPLHISDFLWFWRNVYNMLRNLVSVQRPLFYYVYKGSSWLLFLASYVDLLLQVVKKSNWCIFYRYCESFHVHAPVSFNRKKFKFVEL